MTITTREVEEASKANELNSPKPTTLNMEAATICSHVTPRGMAALRPCSRINANRDNALSENPRTRSVHTLISASAIVMIGQLRPQTRARSTSSTLALVTSSNPCFGATNHLQKIALHGPRAAGEIQNSGLPLRPPASEAGALHKHTRTRSKTSVGS